MPFKDLPDGLFLVRQRSTTKLVDHYGILDVGNRTQHPQVWPGSQPTVVHQYPAGLRIDWLQHTGAWDVLGQVFDEPYARERLRLAASNAKYDLFGNNCEHFARFVTTGKKESTQVQAGLFVAGLVALAMLS
jgi:hypothetical protein